MNAIHTLILNGDEVRSLLAPSLVVEAVERAFAAHGRGETVMPAKVYLPLAKYDGDFRGMPVFMDGAAGIKWVNAHPRNPERNGLPSVLGVFILSDPETARPLAIMDATGLTSIRTGAAAAVATKHLARAASRTLGVIGCGAQARAVISCHLAATTLDEIVVHDRDAAAAERLASDLSSARVRVGSLEETAGADVLCTLTPSRVPIVDRAMVRLGTHINAMGADAPGKQELDERILDDARVFVDDWDQGCESGEVNVALANGRFGREHLAGSLGEVIAGRKPGRAGETEITVFDSTGLAVQDLAVARIVYDAARLKGLGIDLELVRP